VPEGVVAPIPLVSVTVTVHEMLWAITTLAGHETAVEVVRLLIASFWVAKPAPALLVAVTFTTNAVPETA
jgi:hypothetical protein